MKYPEAIPFYWNGTKLVEGLYAYPTIGRKRNPKTSHVHWGEHGLGGELLQSLSRHMDKLTPFFHDTFQLWHDNLPRKSQVSHGGCHGCWVFCPNDIADTIETVVRDHQISWLHRNTKRLTIQHK